MQPYTIILFYKYVTIDNPRELMERERAVCDVLDIKGRMILATEGVNATLEGPTKNVKKYIEHFKKDKRFKNVEFKTSPGTGEAFPRLSIRVRDEIVASHFGEEVDPRKDTGAYLEPKELKNWFNEGKEFEIIDMRNSFEYDSGHFKGSHDSGMRYFRDLPQVVDTFDHLKDKEVVTVCTGGIRCEKASAYLKKKGFKKVYQLHGGMHKYMEKYPGEDFLGTLYTFDNRKVMDFAQPESREVVGACMLCQTKTERYENCFNSECNHQFLCCDECCTDGVYCSDECKEVYKSRAKETA